MATDEMMDNQVDEDVDSLEEEDPKEVLKKVIGVQVTDAGVLRRMVSITVPRENLDTEFDKEYKELISDSIIPGFRRGRAPRRLVEKRFGRDVGASVQSRVVSNAYLAAIDKEDLKVLGDPLLWVKVKDKSAGDEEGKERLLDMAEGMSHMRLPEEGDLTFRCEVEIKPEFDLPKIEGIPVEKPVLKVTAEDVKTQIDRLRARRGSWAPVEEGEKVKEDDMLVCDMKMIVDGKTIKQEDNIPVAARAQVVEQTVLTDLGEKLKGGKIGDTRSTTCDIPDDYETEELRGKKADFEFRINEIKRMQLPPLDESYLASQGFDNEKDYRGWVKSQMESQLEEEIRRGMRGQVRDYLLEKVELELPEGLSSRQSERAAARRMVELRRQGVPPAEIEKHADELRTSAKEEAVTQLKLHFIMEEIAEKLDIDVTEEEINGQIAAMARAYNRRFDRVRDELAQNNGIASLYMELRDEKCIDQLLEKARITESKPAVKGSGSRKQPAGKAKKKSGTSTGTAKKAGSEKTAKKASPKGS
ncbi:MAG: trigger factor [Phycisphaerae bacterium]